MIRSWLKTSAASALRRTGMDRVMGSLSGSGGAPLVIGYHRVVESFEASVETSIPSMLISRRMLEQHLDWIGRDFRFVSLDELGARLDGNDTSRDPIAAVTFDDGYQDFHDHAMPLLTRKGIPAAVFVVSGLVNTTMVQVHDELYLLLARRFARDTDLAGLLRRFGVALPEGEFQNPYQATRALIESLPQDALRRVIAALESESSISADTF
jgi:hypothetical protein